MQKIKLRILNIFLFVTKFANESTLMNIDIFGDLFTLRIQYE